MSPALDELATGRATAAGGSQFRNGVTAPEQFGHYSQCLFDSNTLLMFALKRLYYMSGFII